MRRDLGTPTEAHRICICAARINMCHIGDIVSVKVDNERGTVYNQVKIRVDESFTLEMHIDTDEANAGKIKTGDRATIIK